MTGTGEALIPGAEATPVYAAMLCAGAAAWLMVGHDDGVRRARLLLAGGGEPGAPGPRALEPPGWLRELVALFRQRVGGRVGREGWCLPVAVLAAVLAESWLPLLAGAVAVPCVRRWLRQRERRGTAEARETAVVDLCVAVSGELRAGWQPDRALLSAGATVTRGFGEPGAALLAAARFGGDVPGALREAAREPGAEGLRGVAACWQVAVEGGAGLAEGLERTASALRARRDQREELRAQLAGPRATAVVLALLPLFGLLLGSAMDADPLDVLLHSPVGLVCLVTGALLEWAGLAWVARIVRAAEGEDGGAP
ncbi:type II secretion system F family protein [Streptomyces sp. NPDC048172]|uniref:type II secretion system F family protein n=1 Tax=Streptomyces sp. NPDC048172 TaxID=3365505 RepID=UPI003713DA1E